MKRYKLDNRDANSERNLWESPCGDWVKYEDVEKLLEQNKRLIEKVKRHKDNDIYDSDFGRITGTQRPR